MGAKNNDFPDPLSKDEQYLRLLNDLKALIEEVGARPIDLSDRPFDLLCHECGAYEDVTPEGYSVVYDGEDELTPHDMFLVIDAKDKSFRKGKNLYCLSTYTFICPVCGLYQSAILQDEIEDDLSA